MTAVLDSSAILIALYDEPGSQIVAAALDGALVSSVNHAEIVAKLVERGATDDQAQRVMSALPINVRYFDTDAAFVSGTLRRFTKSLGLSLGDRACIALAIRTGSVVLTADRTWARIAPSAIGDVCIEIVR